MGASPVELRYPSIAFKLVRDATADEIRATTTKPTLRPSDRRRLFDLSPFPAVLLDTIRQHQTIPLCSESNRSKRLAVAHPIESASTAPSQPARSVHAIDVEKTIALHDAFNDG